MSIVYQLEDRLYINLTNRCLNRCQFCIRQVTDTIGGERLWLDEEPGVSEVLDAMGELSGYDEVVFCGFGEPLLKPDEVVGISAAIKERAPELPIRINTSGLVEDPGVLRRLQGLVDTFSISLNAADAQTYEEICSPGVPGAYERVLEFIREAVRFFPVVVLTAVVLPGLDMDAVEEKARSLGAQFRARTRQE